MIKIIGKIATSHSAPFLRLDEFFIFKTLFFHIGHARFKLHNAISTFHTFSS